MVSEYGHAQITNNVRLETAITQQYVARSRAEIMGENAAMAGWQSRFVRAAWLRRLELNFTTLRSIISHVDSINRAHDMTLGATLSIAKEGLIGVRSMMPIDQRTAANRESSVFIDSLTVERSNAIDDSISRVASRVLQLGSDADAVIDARQSRASSFLNALFLLGSIALVIAKLAELAVGEPPRAPTQKRADRKRAAS
jgi:hypothetical protein